MTRANTSCSGTRLGNTYKAMLDMCEPCWKASLEVQYAHDECFKDAKPDPAKVCSASCQPKYCNAIQKCKAGSMWGSISEPFVAMEIGMLNESLAANGTCPCTEEDESIEEDETSTTASKGAGTPLNIWTVLAMGVFFVISRGS